MSHFGLLMGDFEDDPFFGAHMQSMQRMNSMMNSMFDPFGMMGGPAALMGNQQMVNQQRQLQMPGMQMMPFGFPSMGMNINRMMTDLQNVNNPNCHSFTSSSVMTMTTGPDGRPQVYQESMSSRTGPGGIKETKQTVSDSRTGQRKMAIGHHIGERAHIVEREKNEYTGDQEERQDFINLDEEEAETFNQEWETKTRRSIPSVGPAITNGYSRHHNDRLALPSTVPRSAESTSTSNNANSSSSSSKADPSSESPEDLSSTSNSRSTESNNYNSSTSRKREHSPEIEEIENPNHKRRSYDTTNDD